MSRMLRRSGLYLTLALSAVLVACGGDGSDPAAATPTPPAANPPASGNTSPTINGAPATTATTGSQYTFTPSANDADGQTLTFSIANKPAWATFTASNGRLQGTPTSAGTTTGIVISVSDGTASASLPAFSLTVASAAPPPSGPPPPSSGPPPAGTPYPGYTYTLPTSRPFISLASYAGASPTSAAYTRLKGQVDDAVVVTNALSSTGTYDQLVSALGADHYGYSSIDSIVMFRLTNDAKYIQQAIRMVDLFVTMENATIAAGGQPRISSDSYLDVGGYLAELALAYDFGYDRLTPQQRVAWSAYAEQTLFNLWNPNSAIWGSVSRPWSGWSIDDPGNNYYYSFLKATQLWALASQNSAWIDFLQRQKYTQLVPFFSLLVGGGTREGTGYGTAVGSMFENYTYWKDSTGEDLSAYSTHARDTIDYWIHASVPTLDYYAPIGDLSRQSIPLLFDYHRKLMTEAVSLNRTVDQGRRGTWWLNRVKVTDGGSGSVTGAMRYNFNFRYDLLATAATEQAPTSLVYDTPGVGAMFARSDWSTTASWMHTNAGYFDQSHAHEDQGSFSFYKNGWLTVTSNIWSNSGINQGVDVHNVLRFSAAGKTIDQNHGVSTKTYTDSGSVLQIAENLTPVYSSNASLVSSWLRDFTYDRSVHSLRVQDRCTVASNVSVVWQLHTPVAPVRQNDGSYVAGHLHVIPVAPASPTITVVDMKTVSSDFGSGYRLEMTGPAGGCNFTVDLVAQ